MKEIKIFKEEKIMNINQVDESTYIGVISPDGVKGYIREESYGGGWRIHNVHRFNHGEVWEIFEPTVLQIDLVRKCIEKKHNVFAFENMNELLEWMKK